MQANQYPQDIVTNFQSKMHKVLDSFMGKCEQLERSIIDDLGEAQQKDSTLTLQLQQKSTPQMNAYERKKIQGQIDWNKSQIADLKEFVIKIQEFKDLQVESLEQYLTKAFESHPLETFDDQSPVQSEQPNNSQPLVQQLYLQIQDLQIKIKNLELEVEMKGFYQKQDQEMTQKYSLLELAHKQIQDERDKLIKAWVIIQDSNQNLQNERDQAIQTILKLELDNKTIQTEYDRVVEQHQNLERNTKKIEDERLQLVKRLQNLELVQVQLQSEKDQLTQLQNKLEETNSKLKSEYDYSQNLVQKCTCNVEKPLHEQSKGQQTLFQSDKILYPVQKPENYPLLNINRNWSDIQHPFAPPTKYPALQASPNPYPFAPPQYPALQASPNPYSFAPPQYTALKAPSNPIFFKPAQQPTFQAPSCKSQVGKQPEQFAPAEQSEQNKSLYKGLTYNEALNRLRPEDQQFRDLLELLREFQQLDFDRNLKMAKRFLNDPDPVNRVIDELLMEENENKNPKNAQSVINLGNGGARLEVQGGIDEATLNGTIQDLLNFGYGTYEECKAACIEYNCDIDKIMTNV